MALKLLPVFVFMLLWLLFPISAEWTSSTNTSCVRKILQSGCNEATVDNSTRCCNSISLETQTSEVCMCSAFGNDANFVDGFTMYCSSLLKFIVALCPDATLLTSPPTTNISSPVPPAPAISTTPPSSIDIPSPPNNTSGKKGNVTIIAIVVVVVIILVVVTIVISIICIRKRKNNDLSEYNVATLKKATDNFSETNIIGQGGFGIVYKGTLKNGEDIAVKRLSQESIQGDTEFRAEIERLGELKHDNLVKLRGFCLAKGEKFLLYEFLPNKSLADFLFDTKYESPDDLWATRFKIIKGIAKGMVYLHEDAPEKTVHRDLKAANVLLDKEMNPKIADFGLARKFVPDQTHGITLKPMGTEAYMAPEYLNNPELFSFKTDVYAFGILVLEIISGRRASKVINYNSKEGENLLIDAWRYFDDKKPLALVDPSLKDSFSSEEVVKCIRVGLYCVQESGKRPDMSEVVQSILNINPRPELSVLPEPQPPQLMFLGGPEPSTTSSTQQSATYSSGPISSSANSDFKNPR